MNAIAAAAGSPHTVTATDTDHEPGSGSSFESPNAASAHTNSCAHCSSDRPARRMRSSRCW